MSIYEYEKEILEHAGMVELNAGGSSNGSAKSAWEQSEESEEN